MWSFNLYCTCEDENEYDLSEEKISFDCEGCNRLYAWAKFHNMNVKYFNIRGAALQFLNHVLDQGISITCDRHPTPFLMKEIIYKHDVRTELKLREAGTWQISFCAHNSSQAKLRDMEVNQQITSETQEDEGYKLMYNYAPQNYRQAHTLKYQICSRVIVKYWYNVDSKVSSHIYMMIWMDSFQRVPEIGDFGWVKSQSIFCPAVNYEDKNLDNLEEAQKELTHLELKFEDLYNNSVSGVRAKLPISRFKLSISPFCLPALVNLSSNLVTENVDTQTALIAFYFNLGYAEKPNEQYLDSIRKYCAVLHPIIFWGEQEICDLVLKYRQEYNLAEFTEVHVSSITDMDLIKKYSSDFEAADEDLPFRKRRRYSLMTSLKFEIIEKSIANTAFNSVNYGWLDPGIFRHRHLIGDSLVGTAIFSKIDCPSDKLVVAATVSEPGISSQDVIDGVENILAGIICGTPNTWLEIFPLYTTVSNYFFNQSIFRTEQIFMSRIISVSPDLFEIRLAGLNSDKINNVLNISS